MVSDEDFWSHFSHVTIKIQMLEVSGGKIIEFREYADTIKMAGIVG